MDTPTWPSTSTSTSTSQTGPLSSEPSTSAAASHTITDWDRAILQTLGPLTLSNQERVLDDILGSALAPLGINPLRDSNIALRPDVQNKAVVLAQAMNHRLARPYPGNEQASVMHLVQTLTDHCFYLYDAVRSSSPSSSPASPSAPASAPPLTSSNVRGWGGVPDRQGVVPDLVSDAAVLDAKRRIDTFSEHVAHMYDEADATLLLIDDSVPIVKRISGQQLPAYVTAVIVQVSCSLPLSLFLCESACRADVAHRLSLKCLTTAS